MLLHIMFGELRVIEVEHLMERIPIFAFSLLLNLAADDSSLLPNIFLLGLSISFKTFSILLTDRLDLLNLKIVNSLSQYSSKADLIARYAKNVNFWAILLLFTVDFALAKLLVFDVFQGVSSVTCLLFGFQFAIQGVEGLTFYSKLLLTVYEMIQYRLEEDIEVDDDDDDDRVWDNKAYYSKGIDILSALLKAVSHISFIYLLTYHSGLTLPISLIQGTYSSLAQAYTEITHLFSFIEVSKRFDTQLATATQEELDQTDNLCIICREDMYSKEKFAEEFGKELSDRKTAKKLNCGHILHVKCLKEWLERSDSCPLCRSKVFDKSRPAITPQVTQVPPPPEVEETDLNFEERRFAFEDVIERPQSEDSTVNTSVQNDTATSELTLSRNEERRNLFPIANDLSLNGIPNGSQITPQDITSARQFVPSEPSMHNLTSNSTTGYESVPNHHLAAELHPTPSYQTIRLPTTALLPVNWMLLPLERMSGSDDYRVSYSVIDKGYIKARKNENGRDLHFIRPS